MRKVDYSFPSLDAGLGRLDPTLASIIRTLLNNLRNFTLTIVSAINANATPQKGTTAQRPTTQLQIGDFYFDTTLGKPIWIKSLGPTVWVDGAGTTV